MRELENVKDFKVHLPNNQVDFYLKMTKAEGPLENFLRNIKHLNFANIDGEFREIECDKQLTEIILYRNMNVNIKAKPIDNFQFLEDQSNFVNVQKNKQKFLIYENLNPKNDE